MITRLRTQSSTRPNVVSVEHWGDTQEFVGFDAIKKKGEQWMANVVEMHETVTSDLLGADKSLAVTFTMDATFKETGRSRMTELAVYFVEDGKIVREEFFA